MVTLATERVPILDRCRAHANVVSVATLCLALALPVQAATILFPKGTAEVKLELPGSDCNDGSMLLCITTPTTQRAYLLALTVDHTTFVGQAYRVLFRRPVDVSGLAYYTNRLTAQTITRAQMIDEMMNSQEYKALQK
jgi:Domain of unknown function (DUF4214)